jgi:protein-tyrosine-phosphatase
MASKELKVILFVCFGNTCRSLIAEKLLKHKLKDTNLKIQVKSAGTAATFLSKPPENTIKVLQKNNIPYDHHQPTKINQSLMEEADLVLAMDSYQKQYLLLNYQMFKDKIFTLTEYVGDEKNDIQDPYGGSIEAYETCFNHINKCLEGVLKKFNPDEDEKNKDE